MQKKLTFVCELQNSLSDFELGVLELEEYVAIGYWRCKECTNGFLVPNENGFGPRYCPFCKEPIWETKEG